MLRSHVGSSDTVLSIFVAGCLGMAAEGLDEAPLPMPPCAADDDISKGVLCFYPECKAKVFPVVFHRWDNALVHLRKKTRPSNRKFERDLSTQSWHGCDVCMREQTL